MKKTGRTTLALAVLAVAAGIVFASALVRARGPRVERPLPPSPAAPEHPHPAVVDADFSPPRAGEAVTVLYRAFGSVVEMVGEGAAVGDFNGDGSPDLVVGVRASEAHAAEINEPLANWTVQDCASSADPLVAKTPPSPTAVRNREPLLAVVHGFGRGGWRDPEARQAYLVEGAPEGPWRGRSRDHYPGLDAPEARQLGDVLAGPSSRGEIAYWTGARYVCRRATAARSAR
jgi:hypothetical protein